MNYTWNIIIRGIFLFLMAADLVCRLNNTALSFLPTLPKVRFGPSISKILLTLSTVSAAHNSISVNPLNFAAFPFLSRLPYFNFFLFP